MGFSARHKLVIVYGPDQARIQMCPLPYTYYADISEAQWDARVGNPSLGEPSDRLRLMAYGFAKRG